MRAPQENLKPHLYILGVECLAKEVALSAVANRFLFSYQPRNAKLFLPFQDYDDKKIWKGGGKRQSYEAQI